MVCFFAHHLVYTGNPSARRRCEVYARLENGAYRCDINFERWGLPFAKSASLCVR